jgi:hypothetical protein
MCLGPTLGRPGQWANAPYRAHADSARMKQSATWQGNVQREAFNSQDLLQFWFVSCVAVCSCTKQADVMSSVTSLAGGQRRREHRAMCNLLRLSGRLVCHRKSFTHTTWSHTQSFTHIILSHASFTLCHTHNSSHTILHHLLYLSFLLRPASTFVSVYWKKLTCGVIRSFIFLAFMFSKELPER